MKAVFFLSVFTLATLSFAQEMRPTTVAPVTPQQIETHKEVAQKQRVLKKKLSQKASPEEIHKAKQDVQEKRVKANKADVLAQ